MKKKHSSAKDIQIDNDPAQNPGEATPQVVAAIGVALHQHLNNSNEQIAAAIGVAMYLQEMQRTPVNVLTMRHSPYSAWGSKQHGLRQAPLFIPGLRKAK